MTQSHEQENDEMSFPAVDNDDFGGFPDLGAKGDISVEGDHTLQALYCLFDFAILFNGGINIKSPADTINIQYTTLDLSLVKVKSKLGLYLKNAIKSKNTLCTTVDKISELAKTDSACAEFLDCLGLCFATKNQSFKETERTPRDCTCQKSEPRMSFFDGIWGPRQSLVLLSRIWTSPMRSWLNFKQKGKPLASTHRDFT